MLKVSGTRMYNVSSEAIHKSADHDASRLDNFRTFKLLLPVTSLFLLSFHSIQLYPLFTSFPSTRFIDVLHLTFLSL